MRLQELQNFFSALNYDEVRYCHWKSNAHLSKSFESKADFDLLISPRQSMHFQDICIQRWSLKKRFSTADKIYPGMEDYLGFDEATGKIFHLHVHFKLIFGKKHQKNYRLPIEDYVLDTTIWDHSYPIKIIQPEIELVLLILRSVLKVNFGIKNIAKLVLKKNFIPSNILSEYSYLKKKVNKDIFYRYVNDWFPELSKIFRQFIYFMWIHYELLGHV